MTEVNCYICGSDKAEILRKQTFEDPYLTLIDPAYNKKPRYWKICKDCGFVYHSPKLTAEDQQILYQRYRDESFRKETPDAYFDRITALPESKSENYQKMRWLFDVCRQKGLLRERDRPWNVLDAGCGGGVLLHTIRKFLKNARLHGVEPNEKYAALAARRLSATIVPGFYIKGLFSEKFDLITCTTVIEHVDDPRSFIEALSFDLSENGILFLEVPSLNDFKACEETNEHFLSPHHYYFSENVLRHLLANYGLRVVCFQHQTTLRERNNLQVLAKRDSSLVKEKAAFFDNCDELLIRYRAP